MLSYRHAFHAGNHADVLKHAVVVQLLEHLTQKDKAFWYIDTHAAPACTRWITPTLRKVGIRDRHRPAVACRRQRHHAGSDA